jgi:hypothetical protein
MHQTHVMPLSFWIFEAQNSFFPIGWNLVCTYPIVARAERNSGKREVGSRHGSLLHHAIEYFIERTVATNGCYLAKALLRNRLFC